MIKAVAAAGTAMAAFPLLIILLVTAGQEPVAQASATGLGGAPTALAKADIPPDYLRWYLGAAQTCPGLPWSVLAGIGTVESDNGKSDAAGVHSGHNFAGAEGPMQFLPATFAQYAVNADPSHPVNAYDPADAIYTAAAMVCANGAHGGSVAGIERAVFAYNHAQWYVTDVMAWAAKYATASGGSTATTAIDFAKAQLGKPYQWGAAGPDSYDCSGLVYAAYAAAGIQIARTTFQWRQDGPVVPPSEIQPGDLLFSAGSDGTPANPGHVVMYLGAGQVIQAPHAGEDVQIDPIDLASVVVATRPADLASGP